MWKLLKTGLAIAWYQPFAVCTLFVYNLLWGLLLYKLVRSVAVPLLHRYPGQELSREAVQLFWVEGQFQITKTDLIHSYLWWGLGLLVARMLISPMLNAGVYYSLHHQELNAGYRFVRGVRKLTLPFLGLYVMQMALTLAPLYFLYTRGAGSFQHHTSLEGFAWAILPLLGGFLLYNFLLQTLFMHLQIGMVSEKPLSFSMVLLLRNAVTAVLLAAAIVLITLILSAAVMTSAMIWAGFATLLGFQLYRFLHMFCKMWSITAQYAIWNAKSE